MAGRCRCRASNFKICRMESSLTGAMKVLGIDFTSSPTRRKPITCLPCTLHGGILAASGDDLQEFFSIDEFSNALKKNGPWIAGIDFPFGLPRKFIDNANWPRTWADYVMHARALGRAQFREFLDRYRAGRPKGDREHRRATDIAAGSISPQKLYGVPVGLMFFEGAPRLIEAGVAIPGLKSGDPGRIVVEAYPGVLARRFIPRTKYKSDEKRKQTDDQAEARHSLFRKITSAHLIDYGISVVADSALAKDPSGDRLDALLCAIQAAWSWTQRENGFGAPRNFDPLEGWIADPKCIDP
jgi:Protein of unknown function (DUF429)